MWLACLDQVLPEHSLVIPTLARLDRLLSLNLVLNLILLSQLLVLLDNPLCAWELKCFERVQSISFLLLLFDSSEL